LYKKEINRSKTPKETKTMVFEIVDRCVISYKKSLSNVAANKAIAPILRCFLFFYMPKATMARE